MTKKTTKKKVETLAVLAHRARARAERSIPIPMQEILEKVGVSSQWWNRLSRGLMVTPGDKLLNKLAKALKVERFDIDRALAETKRRAK